MEEYVPCDNLKKYINGRKKYLNRMHNQNEERSKMTSDPARIVSLTRQTIRIKGRISEVSAFERFLKGVNL